MRRYDSEGSVLVASLTVVVVFPSLFIKYLIGRTGRIRSVVYINAKGIYASENLECTIRECAIIRNVLHITSACSFMN